MTKKETQFKLKDVAAKVKQYAKREKYYLDKEQTQFIYYYPKFSKAKTLELFEDLNETIKYITENEIDFLTNDLEVIQYTQFLIIKHFTSLKSELKNKSFKVHAETMQKLLETGLFDKFLTEMFDTSEVYDLLDDLDKMAQVSLDILKLEEEQQKLLSEKLQSNFLKKEVDSSGKV